MEEIQTIAEAITRNSRYYPERDFIFQDMQGNETRCNFRELDQETARRAAALQALGLVKNDRVGLIIVDPRDFVLTFLASIRVGVLPVPLYPPLSFGSLDAYVERTEKVLSSCSAKVLIASDNLRHVLWGLVGRAVGLQRVTAVGELGISNGTPVYPKLDANDLAFLQYTSGSTADPKGVMVSHASLLANCKALHMGADLQPDQGDRAISWLPLYHDMGLIGFVLTPIVSALPTVFIPTLRFIKRPSCWLEALHRHRGTVTFGPNFAYALVAKKAKSDEIAAWDLSQVKSFGCGAEPIHPTTIRDFVKAFASCGVREDQFLPAYGMAEATLAISFKPMYTRPLIRRIDAILFQREGVVSETITGTALEFVSCGKIFPEHQIHTRGENGEPLPEGQEGEICVSGPSICPGYWENAVATQETFSDGWLKTGDLGFILNDEVYVTGRIKDLIILNGRNIHPQAIEWAATITGVRKGNVVAFSRMGSASEELILALETTVAETGPLIHEVKQAISREFGVSVSEVLCLPPGTLPKTSSGKLQRRKARQQYLEGSLGTTGSRLPGATADTLTLARHVARSMWSRAKAAIQLR